MAEEYAVREVRDTLQKSIGYVRGEFASRGHPIKPTSRLDLLEQAFHDESGKVHFVAPESPKFALAVEAYREFKLLEYCFDNYPLARGSALEARVLRTLLKDSALPQADVINSPGRDIQLELFVAAACKASGFTDIAFAEPDIVAAAARLCFKIAVKRAKSATGLVALVADAAEQVERAGEPGMIAVDVSMAFNPANEWILPRHSDPLFTSLHRAALQRMFATHEREIQEAVRGKGVRGLAVFDHQLRNHPRGSWHLESALMFVDTTRGNARRGKEYGVFEQKFRL